MKTKRMLALVLALVMLFSLTSFAGAANYADVSDDLVPVLNRLTALGIIEGYPDGTFKPERNITRAEFAKIAVITMGLEKSADLLANVPSQFKDVKVGDWYTKYINVAANQGILKGYPNGNFRPEANITEAEALTIVLRLLGYNDNLPGKWPYNYVTQADRLGLIDAGFSAGAFATRAGIARLVNDALTKNVVRWVDESFTPQAKTLIEANLNGFVSEVEDVAAVSAAARTLELARTEGNLTVEVAEDVKINGVAFADLVNHKVVYTARNGKVIDINVLSKAVTGKVASVNPYTRVVTIGENEVVFGTGVDLPAKNDVVTAYLYNTVVYHSQELTAANFGTVEAKSTKVEDNKLVNKITISGTEYTVDAETKITLNGQSATLANIKIGHSVSFTVEDNVLLTLDAWDKTVTGIVEGWEQKGGKYTSITIDGKVYPVADNFDQNTSIPVGEKATFSLNAKNEITALLGSETATAVIGTLAGTTMKGGIGGTKYYVTLKDGLAYDITDAVKAEALFKDTLPLGDDFFALNVEDGAIKISYNAAGDVTKVEVFTPNLIVAADDTADFDEGETTLGKLITKDTRFADNGLLTYVLKADADKFIITWDGVTGKAAAVNAISLGEETVTLKGRGTDADGSYIIVENNDKKALAEDVIVVDANGKFIALDDLNLDDTLSIAVDALGKIAYIEVVPE